MASGCVFLEVQEGWRELESSAYTTHAHTENLGGVVPSCSFAMGAVFVE